LKKQQEKNLIPEVKVKSPAKRVKFAKSAQIRTYVINLLPVRASDDEGEDNEGEQRLIIQTSNSTLESPSNPTVKTEA
jgi:hypothetical protein